MHGVFTEQMKGDECKVTGRSKQGGGIITKTIQVPLLVIKYPYHFYSASGKEFLKSQTSQKLIHLIHIS